MPTALENSDYPEDLVIDGVDILQLSDDNLYLRLKELGVSVGPVVDTTRSVYQRKLYRLMKGESDHDINSNASYISNGDPKNGPMTPSAYQRKLSRSEDTPPTEPVPVVYATPMTKVATSTPITPLEDPDPYTPTPRRPLHADAADRSTATDYDSASPRWRYGASPLSSGRIDPVREPVAPVAPQKSNTIYATCFEIFMLSFLLIVGYIFFQEIQTYSAAEKEYETSSAQNFVPEV